MSCFLYSEELSSPFGARVVLEDVVGAVLRHGRVPLLLFLDLDDFGGRGAPSYFCCSPLALRLSGLRAEHVDFVPRLLGTGPLRDPFHALDPGVDLCV